MPRRAVEFRAGEFYHVFNRGNERRPIYFDGENYAYFLRLMRRYLGAANSGEDTPGVSEDTGCVCDVVAYCLMPNHYHFVVRLRTDEQSPSMHALQMSYAKAINKRRERTGSLFEGPFRARHVPQEADLLHLSRYVHLNPVVARIVERPEDWAYSSYRDVVGLRSGTLPEYGSILRACAETGGDPADEYRRFVGAGIGMDDPVVEPFVFDE